MQLTLFFFISFILSQSHRVLSSSLSSFHHLFHLSSFHLSHLPAHAVAVSAHVVADPCHPSPAHAVAGPRHPSPRRCQPTPSQPSPRHPSPRRRRPTPSQPTPSLSVKHSSLSSPSPRRHRPNPHRPVLRSDPRHLSILFVVIEFVCLFVLFF